MANAQWMVRFHVTNKNGSESSEALYLVSPDLRDTKEARRRATAKARERVTKKLEGVASKIVHIETMCVG